MLNMNNLYRSIESLAKMIAQIQHSHAHTWKYSSIKSKHEYSANILATEREMARALENLEPSIAVAHRIDFYLSHQMFARKLLHIEIKS